MKRKMNSTGALVGFLKGKIDKQIVRYVIGGGSTTLLGWVIMAVLVEGCRTNYVIGVNGAGVCAYCYSYLINKYFVFRNHEKKHVKQGMRFIMVQVLLWIMVNGLLLIGVEVVHMHYFVAIVTISALAMILNFRFMKTAVFAR